MTANPHNDSVNPGKASSQNNHWQTRLPWILALLLATITFALYSPVRDFDFIRFDDQDYVFENKQVQRGLTMKGVRWAFTTGHASNWHPVTWLSHMLDCQFFGLDAGAHHLTNATLHVANSVLLFLLLLRLTRQLWPAAMVAALFAWHPVHVESVAWVSERKDVLSTFFGFLTLLAYVKWVHGRKRAWFATSLFCFALGLMSKPMLVTLPCVMVLLDLWPLNRLRENALDSTSASYWRDLGNSIPSLVFEKWPFLLLTIVSSIATVLAQREKAIVSIERLGLIARLANAITSYVRYLGKIFWPSDLSVFYPFDPNHTVLKALAAFALVVTITAYTARRFRERPWLLTGWLWFLGMLVPVIGLVQVGRQSMADRYTYVPAVGIFMALTWEFSERLRTRKVPAGGIGAASAILLSICILLTSSYLKFWRNSVALFEHARSVTADNSVLRENLGVAYFHAGDMQRAIEHYTVALRMNPNEATVLYNLGHVFQTQGRLREAAELYTRAIAVRPDGMAHGNLGVILAGANQYEAAIPHLKEALELMPDDADMAFNLGLALMESGKSRDAIPVLAQAVVLKPDWPDPIEALAWLLATSPDASLRNGPKALELATRAVELTHRSSAMPLATLGAAYAEIGQFQRAVEMTQAAIALASGQNDRDAVTELKQRLKSFQDGKPWRLH